MFGYKTYKEYKYIQKDNRTKLLDCWELNKNSIVDTVKPKTCSSLIFELISLSTYFVIIHN